MKIFFWVVVTIGLVAFFANVPIQAILPEEKPIYHEDVLDDGSLRFYGIDSNGRLHGTYSIFSADTEQMIYSVRYVHGEIVEAFYLQKADSHL